MSRTSLRRSRTLVTVMFSSKAAAALLLPTLFLTGCSAELTPSAKVTPAPTDVCIITDGGGLEDGGANESSYSAVKQAVVSLGVEKQQYSARPRRTAEFLTRKLEQFVSGGCGVIVAVGTDLRAPVIRTARENTANRFILVDDAPYALEIDSVPSNLAHIAYSVDQASALAGYLAAAASKTQVVATFGSFPTPNVLAAMHGFRAGVSRYNEDHGTDVQVLGATDATASDWTFIRSETSTLAAYRASTGFFAATADVIYPVASVAGFGAGKASLKFPGVMVIGGDRDWSTEAATADWKQNLIASVQKQVSQRVFQAIESALGPDFSNTEYLGTLENEGVNLTAEGSIGYPSEFTANLGRLTRDIIAGRLVTNGTGN